MDENQTPKAPFPYTMQTTGVLQHSRGVAWTADLRKHGLKVGVIEQEGNGGPDRVSLSYKGARMEWEADVAAAFDGNEEEATYWLLLQEEAQSVFAD